MFRVVGFRGGWFLPRLVSAAVVTGGAFVGCVGGLVVTGEAFVGGFWAQMRCFVSSVVPVVSCGFGCALAVVPVVSIGSVTLRRWCLRFHAVWVCAGSGVSGFVWGRTRAGSGACGFTRARSSCVGGASGFMRVRASCVGGVSGFVWGCVLVGWVKPLALLLVVLVGWL